MNTATFDLTLSCGCCTQREKMTGTLEECRAWIEAMSERFSGPWWAEIMDEEGDTIEESFSK